MGINGLILLSNLASWHRLRLLRIDRFLRFVDGMVGKQAGGEFWGPFLSLW